MKSYEALKPGLPFIVDDYQLVPIERTRIIHHPDANLGCWRGSKQVALIIVQSRGGTEAFDVESGRITLDQLSQRVPEWRKFVGGHGGNR